MIKNYNYYLLLIVITLLSLPDTTYSQTTPIPDSNFEAKLIALGIDTNGANGTILNSDAQAVSTLDVSGSAILDLSGISAFVNMTDLNVQNNILTNLDVSMLNNLQNLDCSLNNISSLDLSNNTNLAQVLCQHNNLSFLSIKNGTNVSTFTGIFASFDNSNLTCIEVDDVTFATNNSNWIKDNSATYSTNCATLRVIDENLTSQKLLIYTKGFTNDLTIKKDASIKINKINIYDVSGKLVKTINGDVNTISIQNLNKGIYFVKINTNDNVYFNKVIRN